MRNLKYLAAKNRTENLRRFYHHLIVYLFINLIITSFKVYGSLYSFKAFIDRVLDFDVLFTWLVWGVVLCMHFVSLFIGQRWEERKLKEFLEQELN